MQDNAMAHKGNNSMNAWAEVFGEWVISQGLWPAYSPDLNPCDLHLQIKCIQIILIHYKNWNKIFSRKFTLFQNNNSVVRLETFFQDMRPAEKQKVGTSRLYFEQR
jgi:hypothetical protein